MRNIWKEYNTVEIEVLAKYPHLEKETFEITSILRQRGLMPTKNEVVCLLFSKDTKIALEYAMSVAKGEVNV